MSQNLLNHKPLIEVLEANRLLRSPDEVAQFEQTLETLAQNPDLADLPSLHLILDDACEQSEVMFSLVHFLESFDVQEQVQAFIQVMPDLMKRAPEWTAILHSRIMNDEIGRSMFNEEIVSMSPAQQVEIHTLISTFLKSEIVTKLTTQISEISEVIAKYGYDREYSISFQLTSEKEEKPKIIERFCVRSSPNPPFLVIEEC
jgi:hypothetical protein